MNGPGQIEGKPTYQVKGAEMFLGISSDQKRVLLLTNLGKKEGIKSNASSLRLKYETVVQKLNLEQLRGLASKDTDQSSSSESVPTSKLSGDVSSVDFFRIQSHKYHYVRAVSNLKSQSCTLHFFGNESLPSAAVHFQYNSAEASSPDLPGKKVAGQCLLNGFFKNSEEEEVKLEVSINKIDEAGNVSDAQLTAKDRRGQSLNISHEVTKESWLAQKQANRKFQSQRLPFYFTEISIDPDTGSIKDGKVMIEGQLQPHEFVASEKSKDSNKSSNYAGEKHFKLVMQQTNSFFEAEFEGTLQNKPLDIKMYGRFRLVSKETGQETISNFILKKVIHATITLEQASSLYEFNVMMQDGKIADEFGQI